MAEQIQSVRYSQVKKNLNNDSSESSKWKLWLTRERDITRSGRNKILLGAGIFVIVMIIILTVAIIYSKKATSDDTKEKGNSKIYFATFLEM